MSRSNTRWTKLPKIAAQGELGVALIQLMMVCNDLTLCNHALDAWKNETGSESLLGPVLAGFLLGVLRAQIVWHTSARWQDAVTYLLLVLFLFLRPQGIIGKKMRLEAQA